jgi:hypothetical protein
LLPQVDTLCVLRYEPQDPLQAKTDPGGTKGEAILRQREANGGGFRPPDSPAPEKQQLGPLDCLAPTNPNRVWEPEDPRTMSEPSLSGQPNSTATRANNTMSLQEDTTAGRCHPPEPMTPDCQAPCLSEDNRLWPLYLILPPALSPKGLFDS